MPEVLVIGPLMDHVMAALEDRYTVHRYWQAVDAAKLVRDIGPAIRVIATDGHYGASRALIEQLPNLEIIVCQGVGYDAIDVDFATQRGIVVTNTPGVLNDAVAELALGLIIDLGRRITACDHYIRAGKWKTSGPYPLTAEIAGSHVGILGLGRIGKEIATRCTACKMEVSYHGRHHQPDQPYRYYRDLIDMAHAVDWLVVIAPGDTGTAGIVSREVMQALGPQGCLVNVARGSMVDEPALIELLQQGALGGAALDVFAHEPDVPEALCKMDNVVLVPHIGSATYKTRKAMGDLVLANLAAHMAGKPVLTPVR